MTKIPSEWPEKMASTRISWSDDVVVLLEGTGDVCMRERVAVEAGDRPLDVNAVKSRRRLGGGASGILSVLSR